MKLENILNNLGLSKNEAKIYLASLEMGISPAQDIARKAEIIRTTGYSVLEQLVQKKIVHKTKEKNRTRYIAEDPKNLVQKFEEYQKELEKKLPDLQAIYNKQEIKPKIRFYEGEEGIRFVLDATLDLPKGTETLSYQTDAELPSEFLQKYVFDYVKRRISKGITQRTITNDSAFLTNMQKRDKPELRNTTMIDSKIYPFTDQVIIFDDQVAIVSYTDKIGLIIESRAVAQTQKAIFELAWIGAQKVGKPSPNPYIPSKKKK